MSDIKYSELIIVSGLPGLYKLITNRANGLIVEDLVECKSRFVSARKHQFTPLESIAIYTDVDTVELKKVFATIRDKAKELPIPDPKASNDILKNYFEEIIPNYDRERVYPKDMKKIIKWYNLLTSQKFTSFDEEE